MDAVNDLQTEAAKRVYQDDEIETMRVAYVYMKVLSPDARNRVIDWLRAKFEKDLPQ